MYIEPVSILCPNRFSGDAIVLTVESIKQRTNYPSYRISIIDNSQSPWNPKVEPPRQLEGVTDDGNRLEYLREQARLGHIRLIEVKEKYKGYGHGENIKRLLKACRTPYAMLLSSGTEIINPSWLWELMRMMKQNRNALGIAKSTLPTQHFNACWAAPKYIPNWMFLDMEKYREVGDDEDWGLKRVSTEEYPYMELFDGLPPPTDPEYMPPRVFLDTGWKLYEKLELSKDSSVNPNGYKMLTMHAQFVRNEPKRTPLTAMLFFGGLDRNSFRPNFEWCKQRRREIARRLRLLREC